MGKWIYIILTAAFIALFQIRIHNPCGGNEPYSAEKPAVSGGMISGIEIYEPAAYAGVNAYNPHHRDTYLFALDPVRSADRYSEVPPAAGMLLGVTDLIGKEIDLKIATFNPRKLTLKIPLAPSLKLWWIGYIPGAYRSENTFGLTYSSAFTSYPADEIPGSREKSSEAPGEKRSATPE